MAEKKKQQQVYSDDDWKSVAPQSVAPILIGCGHCGHYFVDRSTCCICGQRFYLQDRP